MIILNLVLSTVFAQVNQPIAPPVAYGALKPAFLAQHNEFYTKDLIASQTDVKNQGSMGVCHIYSLVAQLEQRHFLKTGQKIKFSEAYLIRHWWSSVAARTLVDGKPISQLEVGGTIANDFALVKSAGLVPADLDRTWVKNPQFNQAEYYNRIDEYLKNIINKSLLATRAMSPEEKKSSLVKTMMYVDRLIDQTLGQPNFNFDPKQLAFQLFPELNRPFFLYYVNDKKDAPWRLTPTKDAVYVGLPLIQIENFLRQMIDRGLNAYLMYEHNSDFVDNALGVMTVYGFKVPAGGTPPSRDSRQTLRQMNVVDGGHAVQVIGYDLDQKTQRVKKWKIKNSWGLQAGSKGYYHMYNDYLLTFVYAISVF